MSTELSVHPRGKQLFGKLAIPFIGIVLLFLIGSRLFFNKDQPEVGNLPLQLDWTLSLDDGTVKAITQDGPDLYVVTNTSLVQIDNHQKTIWKFKKSEYRKIFSNPVVYGDQIFIDDSISITAINKSDGKIYWTKKHPNDIIAEARLLGASNGHIFLELYDHGLYAIDVTSGENNWNISYSRDKASIHFYENTVVILLSNKILIYDINTGIEIDRLDVGLANTLDIEGGKIYFGEMIDQKDNRVMSYDLRTKVTDTIYSSNTEFTCLMVDTKNLYIYPETRMIRLSNTGKVFWESDRISQFCTTIIPAQQVILSLDNKGGIFGISSSTGKYVDEIKNLHVTDTEKISITTNGNNMLELIISDKNQIFHFTEVNR